jgi:hypothetical protein
MLPTLTTRPIELPTPRDALDYLDRRVLQRFTVPLRDLRVDRDGRLRHTGNMPIEQLAAVPLTDVALDHLDRLAAVPSTFARRLAPELHEHTLNELFLRQIAQVTVIVEYEHGHPEQRRVAGVVPGMRAAADETVIARRLHELGLRAVFTLHAGTLEARFGVESVEVLPADVIDVSGAIRSEAWSFTRASRKPVLEVAAHLLRLICTNGAYSNRELAGARLMAWATDRQLADFVSRQTSAFSSTRRPPSSRPSPS